MTIQSLDAARNQHAESESLSKSLSTTTVSEIKESATRMPKGFRANSGGVFKGKKQVCSQLFVDALTRNAQNEEWGRLIRVVDQDGRSHELAMPMSLLSGDGKEVRERLFSMGLTIAPDKNARFLLHEYLMNACPDSRVRCVSQIGWHGDVFVFPDTTIGARSNERLVLQAGVGLDHAFFASGTLDDWKNEVAKFAVGNSRLVLSLAAAPAAMLLGFAGLESGGIHFTGPSSTGKSTGLIVSGSFWGGGGKRQRYIEQWRITDNGLEAVAAAHNDTLLCLDELSQVGAQAAAAAAYMLSNGSGKRRSNQKGGGEPTATWRILFLSNGELKLGDKIAEDPKQRRTAGQEVRVIDLSADPGAGLGIFEDLHGFSSGAALSDHLRQASAKEYGHAAREFIAKVAKDTANVTSRLRQLSNEFVALHCPPDVDGQVTRVAARFGHIAASGELAIEFGIFPWPEGEAVRGVSTCFRSWLEARGGNQSFEEIEGVRAISSFLQTHGSSRFECWAQDDRESIIRDRIGWRKRNEDSKEWDYFATASGWKEMTKGLNAEKTKQAMRQRGLLFANGDKNSKSLTPPGYGKMRLYHIAAKALSYDAEIDCGGEEAQPNDSSEHRNTSA